MQHSQEVRRRENVKDALLGLGEKQGEVLRIGDFLPKTQAVSEHLRRRLVTALVEKGLLERPTSRAYKVSGSEADFRKLALDEETLTELIWPSPKLGDLDFGGGSEAEEAGGGFDQEPQDPQAFEASPAGDAAPEEDGGLVGDIQITRKDVALILRIAAGSVDMLSAMQQALQGIEAQLKKLQSTNDAILDHLTAP